MSEIPIKSTCSACGGEGLLSTGKIYTLGGREHPLLTRCQACDGKGTLVKWIAIQELVMLMNAIAAEAQAE